MPLIKSLPRGLLLFFRLIYLREHWWAEAWTALVTISLGLVNLFSSNNISSNAAYAVARLIAPSWAWSVAWLLVGTLQLWALGRGWHHMRMICAFAGALLFIALSYALLAPDPSSVGLGATAFVGYFGSDMFAFVRARKRLP